jgi:hypothetical protein
MSGYDLKSELLLSVGSEETRRHRRYGRATPPLLAEALFAGRTGGTSKRDFPKKVTNNNNNKLTSIVTATITTVSFVKLKLRINIKSIYLLT